MNIIKYYSSKNNQNNNYNNNIYLRVSLFLWFAGLRKPPKLTDGGPPIFIFSALFNSEVIDKTNWNSLCDALQWPE